MLDIDEDGDGGDKDAGSCHNHDSAFLLSNCENVYIYIYIYT